MKKQMKRIIAIVCTLALAITSLAFMPTASKADDTWIKCTKTTTSPEDSPSTADYTHWRFKKNDSNGAMEYCWINQSADPNDLSKVKFRKTYDATGNDGKPLDLGWAWNTAEIWRYGEDADHPLENNAVYSGSITIHSSMATETGCVLAVNIFGTSVETPLVAGDNTINFSDATYISDDVTHPEFKKIVFNIIQLSKYCEITVTDINMQKSADPFYKATQNVDFVPESDGVKSPWTLRANYDGSSQYGNLLYKFDKTKDASTIPALLIKTAGSVGEQELDPQGQPVQPANRWWWVSGSLVDYATTAGWQKFSSYKGSITFNIDQPTATNCKLFVYVDGNEYPFSLSTGANTLTIPDFMYKSTSKDVKFLFDELPKDAIVSVSDISFTETSTGGWTRVPNANPTFTEGPWNMFANFIDQPDSGNYGVLQYKESPSSTGKYSDYTMRVASASGWLAWSVFARLENYLSDYYDFGDPYDITLTIDSSKATVPSTDPKALDKLLVIVGKDEHYFELEAKSNNVLHITGDNYQVNPSEPHEQILLEMDGLPEGTEITVKDIQINNGPNAGWTNVPNKKDTEVGDWTLFGWWNDEHWSKLAYKDNGTDSGMGSTDIKVRRSSGDYGKMAALATLTNYLSTAKDTKDRSIANGEDYGIKVTIKTDSKDDSISNFGSIRLFANEQVFDFNLRKGTNTYDLYDLLGRKMTYDNTKSNDVKFELDKVTAKSYLTIQKVEFVGPDDASEEVPNGTAFKPEGTPWTLYAITDPDTDKYGAMRYEVTGDPADLSSMKLIMKSVSGWFGARSVRATLNGYLDGLTVGNTYKITANVKIDESDVSAADLHPAYDKKLRMTVDNKDYDVDVASPAPDTLTIEKQFTYTGTSKHVAFDFDQLLKGSKVSFSSIEIEDITPTTTKQTTTPQTTTPQTTTPESTTPESSSVTPSTETSSVQPSSESTSVQPSTETPSGQTTVAPTGETGSGESTVAPTEGTTVKAPGKATIKKIYKKKKSAKKIKIKLKKVKGANGYQVAIFKSKKTAKKAKKALVKKYTKKLTIKIKSKKIKNKKKLFVRARAYVLDAENKKVFGKWSKIKKAKVK